MDKHNYFLEIVPNAFNVLVEKYSFQCVEKTENCLRYESNNVFVQVNYDNYSFELDFQIGLLKSKDYFTLSDILDLYNAPEKIFYQLIQASSKQRMEEVMKVIVIFIEKYAGLLLVGDTQEYENLKKRVLTKEVKYNVYITPIKEDADKAWKEKEYAKVLELYSAIPKESLTQTEIKRKEFSEKKLKTQS